MEYLPYNGFFILELSSIILDESYICMYIVFDENMFIIQYFEILLMH